ncbi:MAG TPA: sigma factor-like helix-turn-helix DNA-binding protein [Chloroflexota bacterium]
MRAAAARVGQRDLVLGLDGRQHRDARREVGQRRRWIVRQRDLAEQPPRPAHVEAHAPWLGQRDDALQRRQRLRGRAPLTPLPDEPPWDASGEDPCTSAVRRLDGQAVRQALAALPPEQCQTIELAYFAGLTHVQIAAAQALPLGTVKGRLRLALARLRRELRDYLDYDLAAGEGFSRRLALSAN